MQPEISDARAAPGLVGSVVAKRFEVLAEVAADDTAAVYRVADHERETGAALKVFTHRALGARVKRRLEAAQDSVSTILHPAMTRLWAVGTTEQGLPYVVRDFARGEPVAEMVARIGALDARYAVELVAQVASALGALHAKNVVHGSVHGQNVFVHTTELGGEEVVLTDAGLAKPVLVREEAQATDKRTLRGLGSLRGTTLPEVVYASPETLSPERIRGEDPSVASDVYALGALMYRLLTASPVFREPSVQQLLSDHLRSEPEAPSKRAPKVAIPYELDGVVLRALAKDPEKRHATAKEFVNELWWALADSTVPSEPPLAKSGLPLLLGAAGAAMVLAGAGYFFFRSGSESSIQDASASVAASPRPTASVARVAEPPTPPLPDPASDPAATAVPAAPPTPDPPPAPTARVSARAPAPKPSAAASAKPVEGPSYAIDDLKRPY